MITNLTTHDPVSQQPIPVTVDWTDVPVTKIALDRVNVEGNPQALEATVDFGPLASYPPAATYFDVEVDIHTAGHLVRIREGLEISSPADLQKEIQKAWKIASTSGGTGTILSVEVRTFVR